MKKIIITAALLILSMPGLRAQGDLNRQVEVTKAYTPETGQAAKLDTRPRMEDTVALRPMISYSIRPAAWHTAFGVRPISAARIDAVLDTRQPLVYLKAGMGVPLQSVADLYIHDKMDRGMVGMYVNHYGQYSRIKTDLPRVAGLREIIPLATWSTNRVGFYGSYDTGERTKLAGEMQYDWNYYTRYGVAVNSLQGITEAGSTTLQSYSSPRIKLSFGNDFSDLSFLNFGIDAGAGYFADRGGNAETDFFAGITLGHLVRSNRFTAFAGIRSFTGSGELLDDYRNTIFNVKPVYSLEIETLKLSVGFDLAIDKIDGKSDARIFPKATVQWDVADGYVIPFVKLDGGLTDNGLRSLAKRNPYIANGSAATANTARYDLHGGISGAFSSSFSYKAFVGGTFFRNHISFLYLYRDGFNGSFIPGIQKDALQVTLGGDLSCRIAGGLEALATIRLHAYPDNDETEKVADLPDMEISLGAKYNMRNRLFLEGGIDITGRRYHYAVIGGSPDPPFLNKKQGSVADLHLSAEYRVLERLGVFIEGRNLLDMRLYPYNHYRGLGINAMFGITLTF